MVKRNVIVLGINDGHDAGAALVLNGQVISAVHEERLNNIKGFVGVPEKSIFEVFRIAEKIINPSDVNLIALASYHPPGTENLNSLKIKLMTRLSPLIHSDSFLQLYTFYIKRRRNFKAFKKIFREIGLENIEKTIIEHQTAHAAAAYRNSPFGYDDKEDVLILTADGSGDGLSSTVSIGKKGGEIKRIAHSSYYDSLGNAFYSEITSYLGLKRWEHESKVMSLAPYGKADYCIEKMKKIIRINSTPTIGNKNNSSLRFKNTIGPLWIAGSAIQPKLRKLLSNQRFDNIAAAAQKHLEDLMQNWVNNAIKKTGGIKKIVCAGGIFLNVKMNMLLKEMVESSNNGQGGGGDIFIYPAPDDSGLPIGAALQGYYDYCARDGIKIEHSPIAETYYGPSYDDDNNEIKKTFTDMKFKYDYYGDIDSNIAELLSKGKILARCTGRIEWGPRALGNRSITADARDSNVIHKINFEIKKRFLDAFCSIYTG